MRRTEQWRSRNDWRDLQRFVPGYSGDHRDGLAPPSL